MLLTFIRHPSRLMVIGFAVLLLTACQTDGNTSIEKNDGGHIAGLAEDAEREGNYEVAAQRFLGRFEQHDDDPTDLIAAARNLRYAGRATEGVRILSRFYDGFSDDATYRFELGKSKIAAGKNQGAVDDLRFAVDQRPDDWEVYSALGIAYDMTNEFEAAQEAYQRALELSDNAPTVLNNYAISLALSGDLDGAVEFLKGQPRAIRRSAHIRQNLAMFMAIQGDMETAGELARMDLNEEQVSRNLQFFEELSGQ